MQQNGTTQNPQAGVPQGLPPASPVGGLKFLGEDGGRSLAEMAQRDLDAALQLLADRAQYITGATGVAIALRRGGRSDMLCRASTGSNAPELGALLSTEFGLSGESVRTKRALRCDDAERDMRVNREVCRQLGIASVVVMPVVHDDDVLGVFELFSGKAHAFGERDLSAVRRLSEMVETAVQLAHAGESLQARLKAEKSSGVEAAPAVAPEAEEQILDIEVFEAEAGEPSAAEPSMPESSIAEPPAAEALAGESSAPVEEASVAAPVKPAEEPAAAKIVPLVTIPEIADSKSEVAETATPEVASEPNAASTTASPESVMPKKKLFWSAALETDAEGGRPGEADQSHVPPVLRGMRKCEACGFPVSAGRVLCVECEEKKWRGQLRKPRAAAVRAQAAVAQAVAKPVAQAFAAAAQSSGTTVTPRASSAAVPVPARAQGKESKVEAVQTVPVIEKPVPADTPTVAPARKTSSPELVLSAAVAPSQSWLTAHKYVVGVLLLVTAVVVALLTFH